MKPVTVTIVIPTFNSGKTIRNALLSIVSQTFKDFEILIIDGLSTDKTLSIVEEFRSSDICIRGISEKDRGIYDAMNKGIENAKGKYLIFLGSDDKLYNSQVLEVVFGDHDNFNYDVLYGDVWSTRFGGRYDGKFDTDKLLQKNICHQAIFFRNTVFSKVGNFNLKYQAHADWEHNIRWFFNSELQVKYIDMIISDYADGGFSSVTSDDSFFQDRNEIYLRNAFWHLKGSQKKNLLKSVIYKRYHANPFFRSILRLSKIIFRR